MKKELFKIQACIYFRYDDPDRGEWVDLLLNRTTETMYSDLTNFSRKHEGTYCAYRIIKQKP